MAHGPQGWISSESIAMAMPRRWINSWEMESPKEEVVVFKRDNNIDSVADGLLHEIRSDVQDLRHCLTQLDQEAEVRGIHAAREAGINQKEINLLDKKVDTIQHILDKMQNQLKKDNRQWVVDMKAFTREITCKIDELLSKLRGGFIKLTVAAAAMIMLLCFRTWRLRKQKRSVSVMSLWVCDCSTICTMSNTKVKNQTRQDTRSLCVSMILISMLAQWLLHPATYSSNC